MDEEQRKALAGQDGLFAESEQAAQALSGYFKGMQTLARRYGFSVAQDAPVTAGVSDGRAQGSITLRHEGLGATVSVKIDNARGDNPNPRRLQNNRVGEAVFSFDDGRTKTVPLDASFFGSNGSRRLPQHPGNFLSALAQGVEYLTTNHLDAQQQGGAQTQGAQVQQQAGGHEEAGAGATGDAGCGYSPACRAVEPACGLAYVGHGTGGAGC